MEKRFTDIETLLQNRPGEESDRTRELINGLRHVRRQGYFTRSEFLQMCNWKSARPRRYFESNSSGEIRTISRRVFATRCEETRMELLTGLKGVKIPTASAILTLTDPRHYGVIDIRVWQLLYLYGAVTGKPEGRGFCTANWVEYLQKLRGWAGEFSLTAREIGRRLFEHHKEIQEGTLY